MCRQLRMLGVAAMTLLMSRVAGAQSSFAPPPPGTLVAPLNLPAHIVPQSVEAGDKPAARKFVNTATVKVDYRIDAVGPSGVGRVDIYTTADRGESWQKLGEDADKQSPAQVDLPGEGTYGIRLAIVNGSGFGGRPPRPGDRPQLTVEVDLTAPQVALQSCTIVPNMGAIDLRWTALDTNFGAEPISLFFRTERSADWQPIARRIKNDGAFRWVMPRDIGSQVFLKIVATDLAGNTANAESATPILIDQFEPEATLVDAAPSSGGRTVVLTPASPPPVPPAPAERPPTAIPSTMPAALPILPRQ